MNKLKEELLAFGRECAFTGLVDYDNVNSLIKKISSLLGSQGGKTTAKKYGKEHFSKIANGWPKGKKRKVSV